MRGADLVLFCVKSTDTEAVARQMAPHLDADALVLSLQNGVENAPTIARHVPQVVVPAVVYVATAMPEAGCVQHHGRGDLVIGTSMPRGRGSMRRRADGCRTWSALLAGAEVPVRICDDVMAELWGKLMVNCAYNAISGLAQASLRAVGGAAADPRAAARRWCARSWRWPAPKASTCRWRLRSRRWKASPRRCRRSCSSTAQDMARASPARSTTSTASSHGAAANSASPTPANQALHALVKLVEAGHAGA